MLYCTIDVGVMAQFPLRVRGVSFANPDGTFRQEIIKALKVGERVNLVADPLNPHDRWAVGVFTIDGQQIGFLPSNHGDAMTLLRGEPMEAVVKMLTGGTDWFRRTIQGKKHVGVVLQVTKHYPDMKRWTRLTDIAERYDNTVISYRRLEKDRDVDESIAAYRKVIDSIARLTEDNLCASAHRRVPTPVDRLSLLLEKSKRFEEALDVINEWQSRYDPIELHAEPKRSTLKRKDRLRNKLACQRP